MSSENVVSRLTCSLQEPQLMMRFPGDLDATNHPSNRVSCPQVQQRFVQPNLMIPEDEDCLYLNVFVPAVSLH
jgi:carboxylesterase type B